GVYSRGIDGRRLRTPQEPRREGDGLRLGTPREPSRDGGERPDLQPPFLSWGDSISPGPPGLLGRPLGGADLPRLFGRPTSRLRMATGSNLRATRAACGSRCCVRYWPLPAPAVGRLPRAGRRSHASP